MQMVCDDLSFAFGPFTVARLDLLRLSRHRDSRPQTAAQAHGVLMAFAADPLYLHEGGCK